MEVQRSDGCSACGQGGASCTPPGTGSANTEVHRKHMVCCCSPPSRVGNFAHGAVQVIWDVKEQGVCWAAPHSRSQCTRMASYGSCVMLRLHFCTPLYAKMLEILEILVVTLTAVCGDQNDLDYNVSSRRRPLERCHSPLLFDGIWSQPYVHVSCHLCYDGPTDCDDQVPNGRKQVPSGSTPSTMEGTTSLGYSPFHSTQLMTILRSYAV